MCQFFFQGQLPLLVVLVVWWLFLLLLLLVPWVSIPATTAATSTATSILHEDTCSPIGAAAFTETVAVLVPLIVRDVEIWVPLIRERTRNHCSRVPHRLHNLRQITSGPVHIGALTEV